jgi:glucosamine 6-phosphate synthetase-like amidotransferase/phosphosugar isomerase protein
MCGLAGVILGTKRRRHAELAEIAARFTQLLILNERRGRHATGVALVDRDGGHELLKRPLPAHEFVALDLYREVLAELSNRTTCILGHTRWPTRGTPAEPLNNQPIRRGRTLGTHNGTILNSTPLARAHGIRRLCQVDTEVLVRLADDAHDLDDFLDRLRAARGELSAALVRLDRPGEVTLIRGNKPLAARFHPRWRALFYASEARDLDAALAGEPVHVEWIPPMTGLVARVEDLTDPEPFAVNFQPESRRARLAGLGTP